MSVNLSIHVSEPVRAARSVLQAPRSWREVARSPLAYGIVVLLVSAVLALTVR
jgi:hypothetical protein